MSEGRDREIDREKRTERGWGRVGDKYIPRVWR